MVQVRIDPLIQHTLPTLVLGLVETADVQSAPEHPALRVMLDELCERLRVEHKGKVAADRPEIAATRRAYRALGDDPTRYRPANEALLRRVLRHQTVLPPSSAPAEPSSGIPLINTIVDINTYVSLESGFALGCYDREHIAGAAVLRRGADGEQYTPIGKPSVDAAKRLVLADDQGIFGSPTADAQRTMVTDTTRAVLFVIFGCEAAPAAVERAMERVAELLVRFGGATIDGRQVLGA